MIHACDHCGFSEEGLRRDIKKMTYTIQQVLADSPLWGSYTADLCSKCRTNIEDVLKIMTKPAPVSTAEPGGMEKIA